MGDTITIMEDKDEEFVCITRYSNPAPAIMWFLEEEQLHNATQTNSSEHNSPMKWKAESDLGYSFKQDDLGLRLKCVVHHEAYIAETYETFVRLNVLCKYHHQLIITNINMVYEFQTTKN